MQVELLYHTPDPERAIATAARLCYAPVGAAELMEAMPEERVKSVLSTIMSAGHTSTLEHASYAPAGAPPHRQLQPAEPALREVHRRPGHCEA